MLDFSLINETTNPSQDSEDSKIRSAPFGGYLQLNISLTPGTWPVCIKSIFNNFVCLNIVAAVERGIDKFGEICTGVSD